jgi:hypothetical protein
MAMLSTSNSNVSVPPSEVLVGDSSVIRMSNEQDDGNDKAFPTPKKRGRKDNATATVATHCRRANDQDASPAVTEVTTIINEEAVANDRGKESHVMRSSKRTSNQIRMKVGEPAQNHRVCDGQLGVMGVEDGANDMEEDKNNVPKKSKMMVPKNQRCNLLLLLEWLFNHWRFPTYVNVKLSPWMINLLLLQQWILR